MHSSLPKPLSLTSQNWIFLASSSSFTEYRTVYTFYNPFPTNFIFLSRALLIFFLIHGQSNISFWSPHVKDEWTLTKDPFIFYSFLIHIKTGTIFRLHWEISVQQSWQMRQTNKIKLENEEYDSCKIFIGLRCKVTYTNNALLWRVPTENLWTDLNFHTWPVLSISVTPFL